MPQLDTIEQAQQASETEKLSVLLSALDEATASHRAKREAARAAEGVSREAMRDLDGIKTQRFVITRKGPSLIIGKLIVNCTRMAGIPFLLSIIVKLTYATTYLPRPKTQYICEHET